MSDPIRSLFIVDGALDKPILHSQGIPLIKRLAKVNFQCWIISFEESHSLQQTPLAKELAGLGITWIPIVVRKDVSNFQRIQMISKGFLQTFSLCRREKIDVIHCRSYRPAVIGSLIKSMLGCGFLFDMRGFLIDEQLIIGRWKASGIIYTLARMAEKSLFRNADRIISNSSKFSEKVFQLPYMHSDRDAIRVVSIPNCVDTSRFILSQEVRNTIRQQLGWEGKVVVIFSGEAARWEAFEQIIDWFACLKKICPSAFLAMMAYGNLENLYSVFRAHFLQSCDYSIQTLLPSEMPGFLNAADVGIIFRKDNPFIRSIISPIKFGEYLACGLPIIINPGIGETERIINQYQVGLVVDPTYIDQCQESAEKILNLLNNDPMIKERCRKAALTELSLDLAVERYCQVYMDVANISHQRRRQRLAGMNS